MDISLAIKTDLKSANEINCIFHESESWNNESEIQLLKIIKQIISETRDLSSALHIEIQIATKLPSEVYEIIKKIKKNTKKFSSYKLTNREVEVLALIMEGFTNKEIANKLFVSAETIKSHRKNILRKTECRNIAMLINEYHQTFFD